MIWTLLQGYFWRWREYDSQTRIVQTEQNFEVPITNTSGKKIRTSRLAGKIDGIVVLPDERQAIIEHKTTSMDLAPESDYWLRLRVDQQISFYFLAAQELGHDIKAVLYNVIRKPTIRPTQIPLTDKNNIKIVLNANNERVKTKDGKKWRETGDKELDYTLQTRPETPEEFGNRLMTDIQTRPEFYYERREIARTDSVTAEATRDLFEFSQILNFCQKHNYWPKNAGACIGFGRCPYFGLCSSGFNINAENLQIPEGFEIVADVHRELLQEE
jgi:citrate lyase gamma subunit